MDRLGFAACLALSLAALISACRAGDQQEYAATLTPAPSTTFTQVTRTAMPPGATRTPEPTMPLPPGVPTQDPSTIVPPAVEAPDPGLGPNGAIQGLFVYPSEGIPPELQACAVNLATGQTTCTTAHVTLVDHRGVAAEGYRLVLPPGTYHAYAEFPGSGLRRAYYNDFVLCGFHVGCPSHERIALTVKAGILLNSVLLGDWYEQ